MMFVDGDAGSGDMGALVQVLDGEVVADSRAVAVAFERRHDNVLSAIRDLQETCPTTCPDFSGHVAKAETHHGGFREAPYFTMTRRGFVVLAGGFKGQRAREFRIAFYDAFAQMEAMLTRCVVVDGEMPAYLATSAQREAERLLNERIRLAYRGYGIAGLRQEWERAGRQVPGEDPVMRAKLNAMLGPIAARRAR